MTPKTVICTSCGWAAFAVSRAEAEQQVLDFAAFYSAADEETRARFSPPQGLEGYVCQRCAGSTFRPEEDTDRIPDGVTLGPVIWDELPEPQPRVTRTPGLMGGVPCVDGTRVPVATVLGEIFAGTFDAEIHRRYPSLPEGSIEACMRWSIEALQDGLQTRRALDWLEVTDGTGVEEGQ